MGLKEDGKIPTSFSGLSAAPWGLEIKRTHPAGQEHLYAGRDCGRAVERHQGVDLLGDGGQQKGEAEQSPYRSGKQLTHVYFNVVQI